VEITEARAVPADLTGKSEARDLSLLVRAAPYVFVWTILVVPALRNMARGWRPLADDASIAIQAWNTFTLHPPLVGLGTGAATGPAGAQTTANPGPLELWLLGPFVHLDPGQGALLGSALLCAAVLSLAIYVLHKATGAWGPVIFCLVILDLVIVSPTPFVDPVWNPSFAFLWFLAFMAVAFAVGLGFFRYLPLLVFIGSVTVDSHLSFLPSTVLVLVAVVICGWFVKRPDNYRWLWWTIGVALVCWVAPISEQLLGSRPNFTRLLQNTGPFAVSHTKTFGSLLGLRALSRAASPSAVLATPRPILPLPAYNDVVSNGNWLFLLIVPALVATIVFAWKRRQSYLVSMAVITGASAVGLVVLYSNVPSNYVLSFTWINLVVWAVGMCMWLTFGFVAVTAIRTYWTQRTTVRIPTRTRQFTALALLTCAAIIGTLVVLFPYGGTGYQLDFASMKRVQHMATIVEQEVPQGRVGLGVRYSGNNFFQYISDEHAVSYLLKAAGWVPGMGPQVNGLLGLPIYKSSPFVAFVEHQEVLKGFERYSHYNPDWLYGSGS
jgi:hypothetical protein